MFLILQLELEFMIMTSVYALITATYGQEAD